MKRTVSVLLLMIALVVPVASCAKTTATTTSTPSSPAAVTTTSTAMSPAAATTTTTPTASAAPLLTKQPGTVQIAVEMPAGWTKVENSVLPVHYLKETASFMVKEEPFDQETLDDVVVASKSVYGKSFQNLQLQGEAEPCTVDEKDAREMTFTCTVSKMAMKYRTVFLFAGDRTYVITFGDLADHFDGLLDDMDRILETIRFQVQ